MGEKIAKETEKGQLRKQVSQGSVALEKPKKESSGKREPRNVGSLDQPVLRQS